MKKLLRRLREKAGESLVESMASVLIFTLSSVLLLTMIMSASDMNAVSKALSEDYQDQLRYTEMAAQSGKSAETGTAVIKANGVEAGRFEVNIYRRDANSLYSFFRKPSGS